MDRKLALPEFLKLLASNDVPVSSAMAVASKVFKEHNTPALLAQLDDVKLQVLGVKDKDLRRLVLTAVRKAGYKAGPTRNPGDSLAQPTAGPSSDKIFGAVQTVTTAKKKRKRDEDLNEFLPEAPSDEGATYGSMDFNDVLDDKVLKAKSAVVNRAPLMTAWATVVAERLGFEREEALSIGSVYTEMNAIAKGISLGIIDQSRKEEIERTSGGQPYVDLMDKRPLYQTQSSKWRALISGSPAVPSAAFSYISRAFRQTTSYIIGALRLLAASYPPQELNRVGFSLYADFRPTVDGWGKRGEVRCERILSLRKEEEGGVLEMRASESDAPLDRREHSLGAPKEPSREKYVFPLEEYETASDLKLDGGKLVKLL